MDAHTRRRRVRALLIQAAHKALTTGEKDAFREALQEQPDWDPPDRWPGPESVTFSTGYQLSPTQPVTRRSKAAPIASRQSVQVPNV